jgi:hypothetical protein
MSNVSRKIILRDSAAVFQRLRGRYRFLEEKLEEFQRQWREQGSPVAVSDPITDNIGMTSVEMMTLRDVGRLMLGMDPEDSSNPFGVLIGLERRALLSRKRSETARQAKQLE